MELKLHKGTVYQRVEDDFYSGWVPVKLDPGAPFLHWKGPQLSWKSYGQIVAFFRWVYKMYKAEAQVRLATDGKTEIVPVVLPQYGTPGTTNEIADHADRNRIVQELLAKNMDFCGTFHSHASMGAFQSGTDKHDEETKNQVGFHATIGKCDEAACDIAYRVVKHSKQYEADEICILDWIDIPELNNLRPDLPADLHNAMAKFYLTHPEAVEFPEEWKTRIQERSVSSNVVITDAWKERSFFNGYAGTRRGVSLGVGVTPDPVVNFWADCWEDAYQPIVAVK